MHFFKDQLGRKWQITLDANAVDRIERKFGICLNEEYILQSLKKITGNAELMLTVTKEAFLPEAKRRGISEEDFAAGVLSDHLQEALVAFLDELVDVFAQKMRDSYKYLRT
jgi:hypothetical protein